MNIAIASKNPLKIVGIENAFSDFFPEEEINMFPFNVNSNQKKRQPIESEILNCAKMCINNLKKTLDMDTDFLVACEEGLITLNGYWFEQHIVYIQKYDGSESVGISGGILIPQDNVTEIINKETTAEKSISKLSKGLICRASLIKQGTLLALSGFSES